MKVAALSPCPTAYPLCSVPYWRVCPGFRCCLVISLLIVLPLPLHPLGNACLEDSTVSDCSLIWFLILSGLDIPALVCYFNLIHHSPLLHRAALLYHLHGKKPAWFSSSPKPGQPGHVCRAEMINNLLLCQTECLSCWPGAAGVKRAFCRLWAACVMQRGGCCLCIELRLCFLDAIRILLIPLSPVLQITASFWMHF